MESLPRIYSKSMKGMIELFIRWIPLGKICLFGLGHDGREILVALRQKGRMPVALVDNNPMIFPGAITPEQAAKRYPEAFYVVGSSRNYGAMAEQLLSLGIPAKHLLCFDIAALRAAEQERFFEQPEIVKKMVMYAHEKITGIQPDLDCPSTFNEKMMAMMIGEPDPLVTKLADKYLVRSWVEEKIGTEYLVPSLGCWEDPDDIDFTKFPEKYVLKTNHGCGWNIIVDGRKKVSADFIRWQLRHWLKQNFAAYNFEMQYRDIQPCILGEEYIENHDGDIEDYKVFCFHGKPRYVMYLFNRKQGLKMAFYDLQWKKMPFAYSYPMYSGEVPSPRCLNQMLELSEALADGFQQVRIDWYITNDGALRFGEMTFTSCAGHAKWNPPEWDERLGELW